MRIFVTGATGFIGSAVVKELLGAGHQVLGLARSDAGASALSAAGAGVHRGTLEDLAGLQRGAAAADAVIHLAFNHDFSRFQENCAQDRRVIETLGSALAGTTRPLVITSGVGMGSRGHGQPAAEDVFDADHPNPRSASELAGAAVAASGVDVRVMRLPQVHDMTKFGLISPAIEIARAKGISAYVGAGQNRFSAVHVADAARLYRFALEKGVSGGRYHAVAEEGVAFKDIAAAIGRGLNLPTVSLNPEKTVDHFGWLGRFVGLDLSASSRMTRERLDWQPTGPDLITDLDRASVFAAAPI